MAKIVTLRDLAAELGMDRSHLRKLVLRMDIDPVRVRTPASGNQLTLALRGEDAEHVRVTRRRAGFSAERSTTTTGDASGCIYVVRMDPEARPERIKVGFTNSLDERMADYRVANPGVQILCTWPARRHWEGTARDCLTVNATLVGGEVYDCVDMGKLQAWGDRFFALLPGIATDG